MKKNKIKTGVCSIAFRQHSAAELIALVAKAGLDGIEWGGDVHVPPGAPAVAKEALARTRDAGLEVSSYGSYCRVLDENGTAQDFCPVLESALALETKVIRIWAGRKESGAADAAYRLRMVEATRRIAEEAAACNVRVAFEFHDKTLTDTNESAIALLREVNHSNLYIYWQPIYWGPDMNYRLAGLAALSRRILNLHVFRWDYDRTCTDFYAGIRRRPLAEGTDDWKRYLAIELPAGLPHFALIEHVLNDSPGQFLQDAETLKGWLQPNPDLEAGITLGRRAV